MSIFKLGMQQELMKEESVNFKERRGAISEGLMGRKGRGNDVIMCCQVRGTGKRKDGKLPFTCCVLP